MMVHCPSRWKIILWQGFSFYFLLLNDIEDLVPSFNNAGDSIPSDLDHDGKTKDRGKP